MLRNYLKLAFRRCIKNKAYTAINLIGLSVGFASFIIIFLFVGKEKSFDQFHSNYERIEHLIKVTHRDDIDYRTTDISTPLLLELAPQFPEIEDYARYFHGGVFITKSDSLLKGNEEVRLSSMFADNGFFRVFDFKIKYGSYPDFNEKPNALVLTQSAAQKLFVSAKSALNTVIEDYKGKPYEIVCILEDIPENSSLRFSTVSSFDYAYPEGHFMTDWWGNDVSEGAVLFNNGVTQKQKERVLAEIETVYSEKVPNLPNKVSFEFQPISQAHFDIHLSDPFSGKIDRSYLTIFGAIAIVILFASLTNYCSLTLSQSVERSKEIGIRRTVGATKYNLVANFLFEAIFLATVAFVFAIIIIELSTPKLEEVLHKPLGVNLNSQIPFLIKTYGLLVVTSVLTVLYPAIVSSKKRISDFKGSAGSISFSRNTFIYIVNGFQASIFIFLISATSFVNKQLTFVQNDNLGFDKEQVFMVSVNTKESIFKKEELLQEFKKSPFISHAAITGSFPREKGRPKHSKTEEINYLDYKVQASFLEVMGIDIVEGRNFQDIDHQKGYVLLNETAVKVLGYDEPIGKSFDGKEVIGVVADFHAESKYELIKPLAISLFDHDPYGWIFMRMKSDEAQGVVKDISKRYETITGSSEMTYRFFSDNYDKIYSSEKVIKYLMHLFTGIALVISFFGLFGSSSYAVRRRLKEISIRKVLGANALDLNKVINKYGFLILILGSLVAVPLSFWWFNSWVQKFKYQVSVALMDYLPVLVIAFLMIIPAMTLQIIKVFKSNTVVYLKDE